MCDRESIINIIHNERKSNRQLYTNFIASTANAGYCDASTVLRQPTLAPTPKPTPTVSAAQLEATYKASTTDTTIATLDKDGNADQGKDVHFTCTILNFVKDSNGNTAGANVDDPNTSGVVQIAFPTNTDLSQLNTGDILEVWGTDEGTQAGKMPLAQPSRKLLCQPII